MSQEPDRSTLANGQQVTLRSIRPSDSDALSTMHARLSVDSVYRRYFGLRPELSARDVHRFTHLDEKWRFALVATQPTDAIVGVARYECEPDSDVAEIAMIVDDELQGMGLGKALLQRLIDVAVVQGVHTLVAEVLDSNTVMLGLLRRMAERSTAVRNREVVTVTLKLEEADHLSDSRRARAQQHAEDSAAQRQSPPYLSIVRP